MSKQKIADEVPARINRAEQKAQPDAHAPETKSLEIEAPVSGLLPVLQRAKGNPRDLSTTDRVLLQRTIGNQAVGRLVAAPARSVDPVVSLQQMRANHPKGHVQAKLTVGASGDRYEQEADRVARQIIKMPDPASAALPGGDPQALQRKSAGREIGPAQSHPLSASISQLIQRALRLDDEVQAKPSSTKGSFDVDANFQQRLASSGSGIPLSATTRSFMEPRFGADFSRVRLHLGKNAAVLNRSINAQAFTHGADIYLGAGKEDISSTAGRELLAHELTHVVQQGSAPVQRRMDGYADAAANKDGEGVIRRKLSGVTAAVKQLGGVPSTKSQLSAMVSMFNRDTTKEGSGKYSQIINALEKYEALEVKHLAKKQASLTQQHQDELMKYLNELDHLITAWLVENNLEVTNENANNRLNALMQEAMQGRSLETGIDIHNPSSDHTSQAADYLRRRESPQEKRYHALRLVLPRIRHEKMEIASGRFYQSKIFSDTTLDRSRSQDDAFGGEMNRLDKVVHKDEEGVFIQDKTWELTGNVGNNMGISLVDPNAGARSVAMYELAKLLNLGVDVIAKTEFATHTSATNKKGQPLANPIAKMGVRMAMAEGREAAQTPTEMTSAEAQTKGGGVISLEDPVLQRSLNALQLIDAIAGQLDRHWNNYYIATDGNGNVTGVVGIDLDMSFASDHTTVEAASQNQKLQGAHFVGMPGLVDSAFANAIVQIHENHVRDLLRQYLQANEVDAAVQRFTLVKDACQQLINANDPSKLIPPQAWGATTAKAQLADQDKTYLSKMQQGILQNEFTKPATNLVRQGVPDFSSARALTRVAETIEGFILASKITIQEGLTLVTQLVANYAATEEEDRNQLVSNVSNTSIPNWNSILSAPPLDNQLLAKCQ